jgi:NADPH:quinone reductase-like Zn-dependent oxidoreductase
VIPVPGGLSERDAACAPIAFSTVQHMLFDNAKLQPGETVLVHAGGSCIGAVAIMMAKKIGCTVITTVGDVSKIEGVKALGATIRNVAESLDKMADGMLPAIDTEVPIDDVASALKRMESRQVFGKIIVYF